LAKIKATVMVLVAQFDNSVVMELSYWFFSTLEQTQLRSFIY